MTNANMGRPVSNKFKVSSKQWAKWSNHARKVFNEMMQSAIPRKQWIFLHPSMPGVPREWWHTLQWNFAWVAADIANGEGVLSGVIQDGKRLTTRPKHEGKLLGKAKDMKKSHRGR